jgi:uncharacterized membrane protein YraQ (UPF0718 family)
MKKELASILSTISAFLVTGLIGFFFNFFFYEYPETKAAIKLTDQQVRQVLDGIAEIKVMIKEVQSERISRRDQKDS